jgi:hypothetical protein
MIHQVFDQSRHAFGLDRRPNLSIAAFRRPEETPMRLFE